MLRFEPGAPQLSMLAVEPMPVMPVPLAEPLPGRVAYNENFTGRVSSPVAGRIVELRAQVGDAVHAGQALAVVDAPDLGAAQADVRKALADEQRKLLGDKRAIELYEGEVLARKDLEAAHADLAQAAAETARAELRLANLNPRKASIVGQRMVIAAPIGGVVADRRATPGMEVRPDLADPLFIVTDLRQLQVLVDLPEQHLGKVAVGQLVSVESDAWPGQRFMGKVERVAPVVDPGTRRVQVRCSVENVDGKLRPEMYARVTLLGDIGRNAVRLPNSALVTEGLYSYVFVEREPGVFVQQRVALLVQDREYSYVAEGVKPEERVVVRGALLLKSELSAGS